MLIFILIGSLIVLNMLVGILVEAVQTVATMEHEQIRVDLAKNASWLDGLIYDLLVPCLQAMLVFAQVLWQLIAKTSADQNKYNKISEEEFLKRLDLDVTLTCSCRPCPYTPYTGLVAALSSRPG